MTHSILINRLKHDFNIDGEALSWIESYLNERSQYVKMGDNSSPSESLKCGVPQGSVLGPLLFTTYISPVSKIFQNYNIPFHHYADDTQLFYSLNPNNPLLDINKFTECITLLEYWFLKNTLQLNPNKTEVIKFGTPQH